MNEPTCGLHQAYVYSRGGTTRIAELTPLTLCRWNRIRDDISNAEAVVGTTECCDVLRDLRTILNELHIYRGGEKVWEGPIVRIEYDWDFVRIFADDVLWQAKRSVLNPGFSHAYPNKGYALDTVDMMLNQCYSRQGDPWNMIPGHLHPIRTPDEPVHYRVVNAWQSTIWEEVDKMGEDHGVDYTVVNRDVYFWDIHWEWKQLAPLQEEWVSEFPRIVEYGNELRTRAVVTNGRGYAGVDTVGAPATDRDEYGYVDLLITNANETDTSASPSSEELADWQKSALRNLRGTCPAPVSIVVPENTTLMPDAPWQIRDLIPGAWFKVTVERLCRKVSEWQRLHKVTVEETAPGGEKVSFSAISAPSAHHVVGNPPL